MADEVPAHSLHPPAAGRIAGADRGRSPPARRSRSPPPAADRSRSRSRSRSAIHDALAAPRCAGISARITFTNHLIDSTDLQGADPLLTGATGRLWLSATHRLRLELQSDNGDAQVVVNNGSFWVYDPALHTVYEGKLPADDARPSARRQSKAGRHPDDRPDPERTQPSGAARQPLGRDPTDVAGQPAYTRPRVAQARRRPARRRQAGLGRDPRASRCSFAVYARGDSSPGARAEGHRHLLRRRPGVGLRRSRRPAGAKVVKVAPPRRARAAPQPRRARPRTPRQARSPGAAAVRQAPRRSRWPLRRTLVGLPRHSVSLLGCGGKPAALVTYGQGLGGIAVIEQPASAGRGRAQRRPAATTIAV